MAARYDRSREDLGNSVGLEHLNVRVPDQSVAIRFYISGLGFTRDPYLVTGLENMWVNIGRSQVHLPSGNAQVVRGYTGLVMPDLAALVRRLETIQAPLSSTHFGFREADDYVEVTCPWGNVFRCHAPDEARFGPIQLGLPYIVFRVPRGRAEGIARFYRQIIGAPANVDRSGQHARARVVVGMWQTLTFEETDVALPAYDGHHVQLYLVNFSGPHRQLDERGLITEESNQHQYRFANIVDPESRQTLYQLEHEIRSLTHPLYARPLVNRDPAQTNRAYSAGYDSLTWGLRRSS